MSDPVRAAYAVLVFTLVAASVIAEICMLNHLADYSESRWTRGVLIGSALVSPAICTLVIVAMAQPLLGGGCGS